MFENKLPYIATMYRSTTFTNQKSALYVAHFNFIIYRQHIVLQVIIANSIVLICLCTCRSQFANVIVFIFTISRYLLTSLTLNFLLMAHIFCIILFNFLHLFCIMFCHSFITCFQSIKMTVLQFVTVSLYLYSSYTFKVSALLERNHTGHFQ